MTTAIRIDCSKAANRLLKKSFSSPIEVLTRILSHMKSGGYDEAWEPETSKNGGFPVFQQSVKRA